MISVLTFFLSKWKNTRGSRRHAMQSMKHSFQTGGGSHGDHIGWIFAFLGDYFWGGVSLLEN
jgi:hypothetical protein